MIHVNSIEEANGKWINDHVQLLAAPCFDAESGKWTALANYYGMMLAIIELRVTPGVSSANPA